MLHLNKTEAKKNIQKYFFKTSKRKRLELKVLITILYSET